MSLTASAGRGPGAVWSPTHVQVTVLQARGLRAKGPGGTSDAYAVIQVGKEKYATSVSERSLGAPVWREEATFELPPLLSSGPVPAGAATLQLTVLHRALLGLDKFLGRAEVDLRELHRDQGRRRTQWYTLRSKPGKKDKERGEIEVDIQFMRNNMTASMFDLSMKDKSRNPFGKLKDKIKGRNKDSVSDTASAIVPSTTPSVDSDDESLSKDKKKKSKIKTLFSKSNLQKTPLSQSMSVLPTSNSGKVLLRPGDFQSRWGDDDDEDESSSASDVTAHKRTASTDLKQLNQISFTLPKKEGLSFLGGLRSKNDVLSRSNVCINGNHVYLEQPEAKSETKDSSPSSSPSPQGFRKKHLFSSTENLAVRSWKEPAEGGEGPPDRQLSESPTKDALKSLSLPAYRPVSENTKENTALANSEAAKETKESKKPENKKSSLLSLVTGKKDVAKGSDGESPPGSLGKGKEGSLTGVSEDRGRRSEKDTAAVVSGRGNSLNPFEEVQITEPEADPDSTSEPKPPVPAARAPQTRAVKPRLDVSPEPQPTARPPPHPHSPPPFPASPSGSGQAPVPSESGRGSEAQSSESPSVASSFSSPIAAPIATSTPIESWPPTDKGQARSGEPSLLLEAELQKENLTPAPNTVSSAPGSLLEQPPIPACEGPGRPRERGTGNSGSDRSEEPLPEQPKMGRQEELLRSLPTKRDCIPPSDEAQEGASVLSLGSGRAAGPAGKPPTGGSRGPASQSGPPVENEAGGSGTTASVTAASPLHMGESVPSFDSGMWKSAEMGVNVSEGRQKTKKRVSFSQQLLDEEEVARSAGGVEEDDSRPQELTAAGTAAGTASGRVPAGHSRTEDAGREPAAAPRPAPRGAPAPTQGHPLRPSREERFSKVPESEASSAKDTLLFRVEGDDALLAQCQSKANDHEGLLSDPLSDLQSASDVRSPIMADLNLTLPSIPEVASDDERIDQVEDGRKTAKVATPDEGASSLGTSVGADGSAPAESPSDFSSKAPKASATAPSAQTAASGIQKPHLGKSSSLEKQLPGPGSGEEENPKGNGSLNQPLGTSLDSPLPSPSLSETFLATHSVPSSPHSDTQHTSTAESQKKATAEGSAGKGEHFGKRKPLLQAWVSPSETHPVSAQPGAGPGSAKHRLHPVKPMNTTATKIANSSLGTATIISENMINEAMMKKYSPSDPAFAYAQLTRDELIQLVLKQKETIGKKELQVRELEDYIDNLLVRVMEETPNILRIPAQVGKKAGKM
ncbi:PREDICTED: rab11 family-interacting protein 1 isoform X1 [Propithecus coquereli]|uniref:rab11 family-interacting protein 1 isoform X1 n=1 Tax=Propithecus coquereli TaxID=379532 RepID=UPI00063FC568|nr:PREDICTED: rab11 family-interacting protein 1 isoform X1 [Propithecus coquereli]